MKKLLFSMLLLFPFYTFSFFKKKPFFHPSFQKIEINGPALKDASYIKIYTGKSIVIELQELDKSNPRVKYYNDFSIFPRFRKSYSWDYKNLDKVLDIKNTLHAHNSVVVYFNKKDQAIAYIITDIRIGAGDPKFEGIGRRVWLSEVQGSLIARCKRDVTDFDLSWNSLRLI